MMRDIFGNEITEAEARRLMKRKGTQPNGYAAPPGLKCRLVQATAGAGTDIRAKAPACRRWERRASE